MVERVFGTFEHLARQNGLTILLAEQNVSEALEITDRAYVLDHGCIAQGGSAAAMRNNPVIRKTNMGLRKGSRPQCPLLRRGAAPR